MPFEHQSLKKIGLFSILIKELCHRFCSWKCSKDANCCSKLTSAQISNISSRNTSETLIDFFVSFVMKVTSKYVFASVIFQSSVNKNFPFSVVRGIQVFFFYPSCFKRFIERDKVDHLKASLAVVINHFFRLILSFFPFQRN